MPDHEGRVYLCNFFTRFYGRRCGMISPTGQNASYDKKESKHWHHNRRHPVQKPVKSLKIQLKHGSSLQSTLQKEKDGIGKAGGWDTQCCQLESRATAEIAAKEICLHGPFASLLNQSNGNPRDPAPGEYGKSVIKPFSCLFYKPLFFKSL